LAMLFTKSAFVIVSLRSIVVNADYIGRNSSRKIIVTPNFYDFFYALQAIISNSERLCGYA